MPKVSGLIVPKLCPHVLMGTLDGSGQVLSFGNPHDYNGGEGEEAQDEEESEEP